MDNNQDVENPVRDQGSRMRSNIGEDEIAAHHSDKWQNQAMYVGLHFPAKSKRHRRHRHRHHHKPRPEESHDTEPSKPLLPIGEEDATRKTVDSATPPAQRVQFILGSTNEDDVEHQSHDIFCEMDELRAVGDEGDMEWKETARWIKFEEDVEEGGERWSKPHVATLSLHSLFELRKSILTGTVMLDLEANNLIEVTAMVLDNMIASKQLGDSERDRVTEVLLSRHHHQHDKKENKGLPIIRSLADIGKRPSSKGLEEKKDPSGTHLVPGKNSSGMVKSGSSKDFQDPSASGADIKETPSQHKFNEHFLKKIPQGAEASNILVGEVDFLNQPIIAFVRLAHSLLLGDLTEVPVPTRFIFIMLGPQGNQQQYHEIGRSIATLMSDEIFHDVAYKAKNRGDLLAGIDEFLDQVTVLPPGEWDPTIRIEPPKSVPSQAARKTGGTGGTGGGGVPNGHTVAEEEEEEGHGDITLQRTGRLFGGLINDVKRKAPFYLSDYKDGLHIQTLASFFFMYFACLTPIITFGGLLGHATGQNMAAMESLMSGAICGISYHLFAGQPLTIIGSTGPVLVFETIVYHFCEDHHMAYLSFRFWIGLWISLSLILIVMFDLSALVRYITRFTEESFALLIALIFIYEAFKKLFHILDEFPIASYDTIRGFNESCWCSEPNATVNPWDPNVTRPDYFFNLTEKTCTGYNGTMEGPGCEHHRPYPDVFFFSCLLFIFTYALSFFGKNFKETRFLPNKLRSIISDFAVMVAIVLMVLADFFVGLPTPKLIVPSKFAPTLPDRGWVVNPFGNPWWTIPAAIAPALLGTILIFMDQQITAVIVNRKEHKLKKGSGYHLDLFVIAIQMAICSIMGLPWFVAATVLSINHVRSLTRESESAAPGERPQFLGVREQRLTGVIVFLFVGLSVFLTSVLKFIPMPVLYGVFLFMGVSSMKGIELCQRIICFFMPPKYQPDYVFLRHVPLRRVYLFTAIQILCLAILWTIKTIKSISIVFPLMVLAMCFVRKSLDWVFTRNELKWLDDIMPEAHKREKEKKKKEEAEGFQQQEKVVMIGSGATSPTTTSGPVFSSNPDSENDVEKPLLQTQTEDDDEEIIEMTGGAVNIPLKDGKSINIPVDRITYNPKTNQVSISEEMSKTAIWKQLAANESNPDIKSQLGLRQRKPGKSDGSDDDPKPVKFQIAEEDETDMLMMPEIVVDPPSKTGTPEKDGLLENKSADSKA